MRFRPLVRELALAFGLAAFVPTIALGQDDGLPLPGIASGGTASAGGIPNAPASPSAQDSALALAESATTAGNEGFNVLDRDTLSWKNEREPKGKGPQKPAPKTPEERKAATEAKEIAEAKEKRHERIKSALAQVSEPVLAGQANALQLTANGGSTELDLGHAEGEVSVGLDNSLEGQVSAVEVKQAVGPLDLSADALTAKAGIDVGVEGVGVGAGATLVEAGADLGPVDGSVGLGIGASAQVGLHGVDFKLGLGIEASVSVDPVGAATDAWHAFSGLWGHHSSPHATTRPDSNARKGIAECLPLQGS